MKDNKIKNFLIISCIGQDDKLGLRINKEFFIYSLPKKKHHSEQLVGEILKLIKKHNVNLDKKFTVIVNQGPGSFSGIRISLAVAKGLEITKKVNLFGFNNQDLDAFDKKNIEKLLNKNLIEKKLIKPIYLS
tara:strand:- start:845 stop:1240 length:396 start_codon:yes stop_codon:yes gene_type:complete